MPKTSYRGKKTLNDYEGFGPFILPKIHFSVATDNLVTHLLRQFPLLIVEFKRPRWLNRRLQLLYSRLCNILYLLS